MASAAIYTPEMLALATSLADHPWREDFTHSAAARSRSCGSSIAVGLETDSRGQVCDIGLRSQACAVGQAAAAIFAQAASGQTISQIVGARDAIAAWLAAERDIPEWPGLEIIAAARDYPGRHGAVMLPWQAASEALCT